MHIKFRHWKHYLAYGLAGATLYATTVAIYSRDASFQETWLLFAGNLAFLMIISASLFSFNRHRRNKASTVSMLTAGHITTAAGILISIVACFIILLIYVPGLLHGRPVNLLKGEPVNIVRGKTNGLVFIILMNTLMGNFVAGSAATIIFSFVLKNNPGKQEIASKPAAR